MEKIIVRHIRKDSTYPILIGRGILSQLKEMNIVQMASSVVVISDENVSLHWKVPIVKILKNKKTIFIELPAGEKNKTLKTLGSIWKKMLENGVDRSSVVVTLGGGVVCDIGGLAAGTFMRGIPVVHIPTSLLAQVDASVGGKTAVDFNEVKNSIGIFHSPSAVIIDVATLATLPHKEIISGLAEIIKHLIIADKPLFTLFAKMDMRNLSQTELKLLISQSISIKKRIVEHDEMEKNGIRKALNFGHTVGHAVESLSINSKCPLSHGEAVALGMIAETRMSLLLGHISLQEEVLISSTIARCGLPTHISNTSLINIKKKILTDKKNVDGTILWSLPLCIGKVVSNQMVSPEVINKGILAVIK